MEKQNSDSSSRATARKNAWCGVVAIVFASFVFFGGLGMLFLAKALILNVLGFIVAYIGIRTAIVASEFTGAAFAAANDI